MLQVRLLGFESFTHPPCLTVIPDKLFNCPKSQFPHLENGNNDGINIRW